jgi:hypothetical protein
MSENSQTANDSEDKRVTIGQKKKKSDPERIRPYRFKPGNPGGPGRPKGYKDFRTVLAEVIDMEAPQKQIKKMLAEGVKLPNSTWRYLLASTALLKAAGGSTRHLEIVLDRLEGAVKQQIETSGNLNVNYVELPKEFEE